VEEERPTFPHLSFLLLSFFPLTTNNSSMFSRTSTLIRATHTARSLSTTPTRLAAVQGEVQKVAPVDGRPFSAPQSKEQLGWSLPDMERIEHVEEQAIAIVSTSHSTRMGGGDVARGDRDEETMGD
jgi:hypothetical protein